MCTHLQSTWSLLDTLRIMFQRVSSPRVPSQRRRRLPTFVMTTPLKRSSSMDRGLHQIVSAANDEKRANYRECHSHQLELPSQSMTRINHADVAYKQPNDRAGAVRYIKHLRFQLYANQQLQLAFRQRVLDTSHDHELEQVVDSIRRTKFEMRFGHVSRYDELFVNSWQDGEAAVAAEASTQAEQSCTSSGVSSTTSSPAVSPLKRQHQRASPSPSSSSSGVSSSDNSPPSAVRPKKTACRKRTASKPTAAPAPIMSITQSPRTSAAETCRSVNIKALIALWESRVVDAAAKHDLYTAMPIYYRANMSASWRRANEVRTTVAVQQKASLPAEKEEPSSEPMPIDDSVASSTSTTDELLPASSSTPNVQPAIPSPIITQPPLQFFDRQSMLTVYREMQAAKTEAKAAAQPVQQEPMALPPVAQKRVPVLSAFEQMQQAQLMANRHPKLFVPITAIENRNINYHLTSTDDEAFADARRTMSAQRPNRLRDESLGRMVCVGRAV